MQQRALTPIVFALLGSFLFWQLSLADQGGRSTPPDVRGPTGQIRPLPNRGGTQQAEPPRPLPARPGQEQPPSGRMAPENTSARGVVAEEHGGHLVLDTKPCTDDRLPFEMPYTKTPLSSDQVQKCG